MFDLKKTCTLILEQAIYIFLYIYINNYTDLYLTFWAKNSQKTGETRGTIFTCDVYDVFHLLIANHHETRIEFAE